MNEEINIEDMEKRLIEWGYIKEVGNKHYPYIYNRSKYESYCERIFFGEEVIIYAKYKNLDFTGQIDYCVFSNKFLNKNYLEVFK